MTALREQQREDTRRRLYDAALELFRRDGVAACRIDDIVRQAGVSRGSFYFHFPTKEDVLIDLMRDTERRITAALDELPADAALSLVIDSVIGSLVAIWEPDPSLLPEVGSVGLRTAASELAAPDSSRLRSKLAARFLGAARRGELSSLLPAEMLSDLYLGHTLTGLLAWFGNQSASMRAVLQAVTTLFWSGAGNGAPSDGAPTRQATSRRAPPASKTRGEKRRRAEAKPKPPKLKPPKPQAEPRRQAAPRKPAPARSPAKARTGPRPRSS